MKDIKGVKYAKHERKGAFNSLEGKLLILDNIKSRTPIKEFLEEKCLSHKI